MEPLMAEAGRRRSHSQQMPEKPSNIMYNELKISSFSSSMI